jgi:hypothetical protein
MSRHIRWVFQRWGKDYLVFYIGNMAFPYLLIDRQRKHLGVSASFEWWADDERFYCGFPPSVFMLDCRDQTYTVKIAGWDEQGVPAMILDRAEFKISLEELKSIYRATCGRSGRSLPGLDQIPSRLEFSRWILAGRGRQSETKSEGRSEPE